MNLNFGVLHRCKTTRPRTIAFHRGTGATNRLVVGRWWFTTHHEPREYHREMPTSEELLELAERCAEKLELEGKLRHVPSFSDAEDQCEGEYEDLLQAIHEDEMVAPVDIQRQEQLVEQIAAALPEAKRTLIVELADNHARHVWLQQRALITLGLPSAADCVCAGADRR